MAKKKGLYKGRKKKLDHKQVAEIKARVSQGDKKSEIAREFSMSRETLYQVLRSYID